MSAVRIFFLQAKANATQREFERVARDTFDVWSYGPAESGGNGARQRDRLNLYIEAARALFIAPIRVLPPKEAVFLAGRKCVLGGRTRRVDLANLCAAGGGISVLRIELRERDVVVGVEHHGDRVMLTHTHGYVEAALGGCNSFRLLDLGSEESGIPGVVAEKAIEIGGGGAGHELGGAPMMEHCSGELRDGDALNRRPLLLALSSWGKRNESNPGCMLRRDAGFHCPDVSVESSIC